jgi:3-oxoacyl-[acyl-carrier protein] reductase
VNTFEGKVALVTGSSRGIGRAIAEELARLGAAVAVHGRHENTVAQVEKTIKEAAGKALAVTADITNFEQIEAMRRRIEDGYGAVDILVANAGANLAPPAALEDISEETWRATVDVNLSGTFLTLKSFLPSMKARGSGSIITISSAAGRRPHPRSPIPYSAAKAGIELMTQDVAAQAGPFGIRANCVAPETILTETNQRLIPQEQQSTLVEMHPLRRLGTPQDVANAAVFLASDKASWITGVVLDVSGGAVMS